MFGGGIKEDHLKIQARVYRQIMEQTHPEIGNSLLKCQKGNLFIMS